MPRKKRKRGVRFAAPELLSTVILFDPDAPLDDTSRLESDMIPEWSSSSCSASSSTSSTAFYLPRSQNGNEIDNNASVGSKKLHHNYQDDIRPALLLPAQPQPHAPPLRPLLTSAALREGIPAPLPPTSFSFAKTVTTTTKRKRDANNSSGGGGGSSSSSRTSSSGNFSIVESEGCDTNVLGIGEKDSISPGKSGADDVVSWEKSRHKVSMDIHSQSTISMCFEGCTLFYSE